MGIASGVATLVTVLTWALSNPPAQGAWGLLWGLLSGPGFALAVPLAGFLSGGIHGDALEQALWVCNWVGWFGFVSAVLIGRSKRK
jgi:hypothetical protein